MKPRLRALPPPPPELEEYFTTGHVAGKIHATRQFVHAAYKAGKLKGVIIGREPGATRGGILRFRLRDVQAFIEGRE